MTKKQSARAISIALMVVTMILLTMALPASAQEPTPVLTVEYNDGSTTNTAGSAIGPTWQFYVTYTGSVASARVTMPDGVVIPWDGQNGGGLTDPCGSGSGQATWHWVLTPSGVLTISGAQCVPLAVTLLNFDAICQVDHVVVTWETGSEIGNLGFNLLRAEDESGQLVQSWFIPSQSPGSGQGFAYVFDDDTAQQGQTYWYWLEAVDFGGGTVRYGPVVVTCQTPSAVTLSELTATTGVVRPPGCMGFAALGLGALGVVAYTRRRNKS